MRRFFSWLVVFLGFTVFYQIDKLFCNIVLFLYGWLKSVNEIAFYIILFLTAIEIIWFAWYISFVFAGITVALSQKVYKSTKGSRYISFSIYYIFCYLLMLVGTFLGVVSGGTKAQLFCLIVIMVSYSVSIWTIGKSASEDDGPDIRTKMKMLKKLISQGKVIGQDTTELEYELKKAEAKLLCEKLKIPYDDSLVHK